MSFTLSIPKDRIPALPAESFKGKIIVIDNVDDANAALQKLEQVKIVGFDTETRPSFKKGVSYKVSLMQISTQDVCYLFRINKIGLYGRLRRFIENPDVAKIGLSLKDDFFVLHKIHDFEPQGFIDLQEYTRQFNIGDTSLQKIYAIVFGKRISKGQRLTNWEVQKLTDAQQHYAALDAWACLHLYHFLNAGLFIPEQSPYKVIEQELEEAPDTEAEK